jgi:hypothetical protein
VLFDVGSSKDCKRPKEVAEVHVNEHGMGHVADCEIRVFGNAVLGWRVWDCLFI